MKTTPALAALIGSVLSPVSLVIAQTSATGITTSGECSRAVVEQLDRTNSRSTIDGGRARIVQATCYGGALVKVGVTARDGSSMVWEPKQGYDDLVWMLYHGRERR